MTTPDTAARLAAIKEEWAKPMSLSECFQFGIKNTDWLLALAERLWAENGRLRAAAEKTLAWMHWERGLTRTRPEETGDQVIALWEVALEEPPP
jgi:hypothetical protein